MPGSELKDEQGHNPATSRYYWHSQHCMPGWQGQVAAAPPQGVFRSSLRANGSRECAPDDRLREAIHVTAVRHCERSEAIHVTPKRKYGLLRRFAPRNDDRSL